MDTSLPLALLGGLTPQQFMKRHWQKKPLLVRQAIPEFRPLLDRAELVDLAAQDGVESRLVEQLPTHSPTAPGGWRMRKGPFQRRAIPPFRQGGWTLLVQGVDALDNRVHQLLQQFRFVPQARLDDLMISYATDGGGVGPHFDSYDVFLLQAHGRRRWRIGRQKDFSLQPDVPLKILSNFVAEEEFVLEPGDMLYLPPRYAHDGIAEGECMTYSIGFRSPQRGELARELLLRLADDLADAPETLYRDPSQPAVDRPGDLPADLQTFAREAVEMALDDPLALARVLGEYLTEPKQNVWFEPANEEDEEGKGRPLTSVVLDRRSRMAYDAHHIFINGEAYRAAGRDATLMRQLADQGRLDKATLARASSAARDLLQSWYEAGWLQEGGEAAP